MIPIRDYNPATRRPYVTVLLIASCILIFLWQMSLDPRSGQVMVHQFGFVPALLFDEATFGADGGLVPAWVTLFSSMFLHGGFMHLAGNMLYLWIFGNNIEDVMGHVRYLVFYLVCGLAAAMAQALPDMGSTVPMIGASGAISGVLGAYLLLFPKAQVQVVIPIGFFMTRTIPAGWLLGIWIAFQVFGGVASDASGGGVAWWAHVGGFVAGMALVHLFRQKDPASTLEPYVPQSREPAKPTGRSRIPDSRPEPRPTSLKPLQKPEPPPLPRRPDRPTVQRRRDP
ncbi:MAG: rhomboid family intramembrane serine protease [Geminicoccaceae bacterium]